MERENRKGDDGRGLRDATREREIRNRGKERMEDK